MRLHLVYSGPLPASANKSKPDDVRAIRDRLHPQLELLWRTHSALKRLRWTAHVPRDHGAFLGNVDTPFTPDEPPTELQEGFVDLCEPVSRDGKVFVPLVRKSLDLNCTLNITFLRQEDPGALILQGGDLDGRIKTLFDALRVPEPTAPKKYPQAQDPTYCLMESDTLISDFRISSGRLLLPQTSHPHEVQLVIEVSIHVLRLGPWNACLAGD